MWSESGASSMRPSSSKNVSDIHQNSSSSNMRDRKTMRSSASFKQLQRHSSSNSRSAQWLFAAYAVTECAASSSTAPRVGSLLVSGESKRPDVGWYQIDVASRSKNPLRCVLVPGSGVVPPDAASILDEDESDSFLEAKWSESVSTATEKGRTSHYIHEIVFSKADMPMKNYAIYCAAPAEKGKKVAVSKRHGFETSSTRSRESVRQQEIERRKQQQAEKAAAAAAAENAKPKSMLSALTDMVGSVFGSNSKADVEIDSEFDSEVGRRLQDTTAPKIDVELWDPLPG